MSFSRSKANQDEIFWMHFFPKIWHVENFLNQNLTRCRIFILISDALYFYKFKIWHIVKILIKNPTRKNFNRKSDTL